MRTKKTAEWQQVLAAAEVPYAPVWTYADVFGCPQAAARGLRVEVRDPSGRPVDLVGTPFHIAGATLPAPTAPPMLGQHTDEVLTNLLGMDANRLEELRRQGVI
jgi:crotonobetainyl-CoA:carnitine CoA-transferase CaiB-like acyl-CoA transferase